MEIAWSHPSLGDGVIKVGNEIPSNNFPDGDFNKINLKNKNMKKILILANYMTNERMMIMVYSEEKGVLEKVNAEHGGNWIIVNGFKNGDVLKFTCEEKYQGFDNRADDNYCKGSLTISKP